MMERSSRWAGLLQLAGSGLLSPRALSVLDSRAVVRSLFLSSASQLELLAFLAVPRSFEEIVAQTNCSQPDRLQAWLSVGLELRELRQRTGRFVAAGRRARAIANGDRVLEAHYRSIVEYQVGPYAELGALLSSSDGGGRDDIDRYAEDIAQVSLAAAPFVESYLQHVMTELEPSVVLDVGCGTGHYSRVAARAGRNAEVIGIDLSARVVELATRAVSGADLESRCTFVNGDVREWLAGGPKQIDLVLLINNIYYFDPAQRVSLYRDLAAALSPGGQLVVVSMTTPGSVAAAHLNFMLVSQRGRAALPGSGTVEADLATAGLHVLERRTLVPTEPFVGIRAKAARAT